MYEAHGMSPGMFNVILEKNNNEANASKGQDKPEGINSWDKQLDVFRSEPSVT